MSAKKPAVTIDKANPAADAEVAVVTPVEPTVQVAPADAEVVTIDLTPTIDNPPFAATADLVIDPNVIVAPKTPAQGVAPRKVATSYGGIMVCLSTATVYDGAPREAVECGWLEDQIKAGTMYEVKD